MHKWHKNEGMDESWLWHKRFGHFNFLVHKELESDRGIGYSSKEFDKFQEGIGMEHPRIIGNTPDHNNRLKRKNRTVVEKTRSMLLEKGLSKIFWLEAVSTVV